MIDKATADAVTLAIAVLGAALGVLNFWRSWAADRVRVRVRTAHSVASGGQAGFTIDVVNLSTFPVTLTHVGLDLIGTDRHMQIPMPLFVHGQSLPVRLEPRAACTCWQPLAALEYEQLSRLKNAYVLTACGLKLKSPRKVFRDLNRMAAAAADPPPLR